MSEILLPLGLFLAAICTVYILLVDMFDVEYHRTRDGSMAGIGVLGCILMLIGLFTFHIP
jgi:hypothetical protein